MFVPWGTAGVLLLAFAGLAVWGRAAWRLVTAGRFFGGPAPPAVPAWGMFAGAAAFLLPPLAIQEFGLLGGDIPIDRLRRAAVAAGLSAFAAGAVWFAATGTRRAPRRARDLRDGGAAFLLALSPVVGLMTATRAFRTVEGGNPLLQSLVADPAPAAWAWLAASAVVFAPAGEEVLFRGLVLGGLRSAGLPVWGAVAVSAAAFVVLHPPQDWPPLFVLACVLGWCRVRTGSLVPCVFAHSLFNATFLAQVALDGPAAFA